MWGLRDSVRNSKYLIQDSRLRGLSGLPLRTDEQPIEGFAAGSHIQSSSFGAGWGISTISSRMLRSRSEETRGLVNVGKIYGAKSDLSISWRSLA